MHLNLKTKFAELCVDDQRITGTHLPLQLPLEGLEPLQKVTVNYSSQTNIFNLWINDDFAYETVTLKHLYFKCDKLVTNGEVAHEGLMEWSIDEIEDKIITACSGRDLYSLEIEGLDCNNYVANELFDVITGLS